MGFSSGGSSASPGSEITNQHVEGDMDPFPPVMFESYDHGELFMNSKVQPNYREAKKAAKVPIQIKICIGIL